MRNLEITVEKEGCRKLIVRFNGVEDRFRADEEYFKQDAMKILQAEGYRSIPLTMAVGIKPGSFSMAVYDLIVYSYEQGSTDPAILEYDFITLVN